MKTTVKRITSWCLAFALLGTSLAGCSKKPQETNPTQTNPSIPNSSVSESKWVTYDASQDAPFLPKDIFSNALYVPGMVLDESGQYRLDVTARTDVGAFVLKGEYGKCYEIKIPAGVPCAKAVRFNFDPRTLSVGQQKQYASSMSLKNTRNPTFEVKFMYTCRAYEEYLVIYTGTAAPIYIGERNILAAADTHGPWFVPEPVGSIAFEKTLGDVLWSSEDVVNNLYEPVRSRYPEYITRETIGKDATGLLNMYSYIYTPKDYEITIFLTGGMHGDESVGYFSLAKIMQLIADAKPEDRLLYTLRQKVRFVVIPIVNVWGVTYGRLRTNGNSKDLNRDFNALSQQESLNVMACFAKYASNTVVAMDFHIAITPGVSMWFNFINFSDNAVANYKTTNHMHHRYMQLGYSGEYADLSKLPGSYAKGNQYFEGRIWNQYGVPTITVEFMTNDMFPPEYSDRCMTLAVETYVNFIIQNALFYLQKN